jgi:manganese transport protein
MQQAEIPDVPPPSRPLEAAGGPERRRFAFLGAAALVSVGYVDPGNWATDLEGGARFGYQLLWVLVLSGLIATLLQTLSARLGMVSGLDLAAACRVHFPERLRLPLWLLAEIAIIACDMAEVLGSAVALNLLFGLPLVAGALLTACDVFLILALQRQGTRRIEVLVTLLVLAIGACLGAQLFLARPDVTALSEGLMPRLPGDSLYIAIGILGATVMPHNLYLHSAIVPKRDVSGHRGDQARALRRCFSSTAFALGVALLLNAAILVMAAAVFSTRGIAVSSLADAHRLLTPLVGTSAAAVLFALALLCSGQSSTITGTLAGQVVMEGFVRLRLSPAARRMLTRSIAIVPAVVVLSLLGERGTMPLLVASQVVLSLQLPFAIVPLVRFSGSPEIMGRFASPAPVKALAVACAGLVIAANGWLVSRLVVSWYGEHPMLAVALGIVAFGALGLLACTAFVPLRLPWSRTGERLEGLSSTHLDEARAQL